MRIAELASQTLELSDATRSMILARIEEALRSATRFKSSRAPAPTRIRQKDPPRIDSSCGMPASTTERLDQLEQTLAAMRRTFATIVHLSRRAGRCLLDRKET